MSLLLQKALSILLLPLYAHFLAPDQYGIFALLNTCGRMAAPVLSMGLGPALIWAVVYRQADERTAFGSAIAFLLLYGTLTTGLMILFAPHIAHAVFGDTAHTLLLRLVLLAIFLDTAEHIFITRCRIADNLRMISVIISARVLLIAALQVLFLAALDLGIAGLILAHLVTSLLFSTGMMIHLWARHPPLFSMPGIMPLLRHGWPMVPTFMSGIVLAASDRFFVQHFRDAHEVGLYALGYNIGMALTMIVYSVQMAWMKQMFDIARDDPQAKQVIGRLATYYLLVLACVALALSLFSREIIMLLTPETYHAAALVVPWVAAAYVLNGWTLFTNVGMRIRDKNHLAGPIVVGIALLNIALNFLLVPTYGMMGAAWATVVSYAAQLVAFTAVGQRLWHVPYEYARIAKLGAVLLLAFGTANLLAQHGLAVNVTIKLAVLAAVPAGLWALRFFRPDEVKACRRRFITRADRSDNA